MSCASATPSFFAMGEIDQAGCLCYKTATNSGACVAVPTLDLGYDKLENNCWNFFSLHKYNQITQLMDNTTRIPGPRLCGAVQSEIGLPSALPPTTIEGRACIQTGLGGDGGAIIPGLPSFRPNFTDMTAEANPHPDSRSLMVSTAHKTQSLTLCHEMVTDYLSSRL